MNGATVQSRGHAAYLEGMSTDPAASDSENRSIFGPIMAEYVRSERPTITEAEYDALDDGERPCGVTRPGTLGYQRCWRVQGHAPPHLAQDGEAWTVPTDSESGR